MISSRTAGRIFRLAKRKPAKRQGRKATDPRFLPDVSCDAFKDPKIAGLPKFVLGMLGDKSMKTTLLSLTSRSTLCALVALFLCTAAAAPDAPEYVEASYIESYKDADPWFGEARDESVSNHYGGT